MTVKELMAELAKCNPDDIVMYDIEAELDNEALIISNDAGEVCTEYHFGIDDVMIGGGTIRGFVFLTADRLED